MPAQFPPGDRLYARLERFHCECPACGQVIIATEQRRSWNPITGRLHCPFCHRRFGTGLLLYPVAHGGGAHGVERRPSDWKPTADQQRQLRLLSPARYINERKRPGDRVNLRVELECTCTTGDQRDGEPECPLHPIAIYWTDLEDHEYNS